MFSEELSRWLRSGERGISSNAIVEVMERMPFGTLNGTLGRSHPRDPSDFNRCVCLLEAVPEYRDRMDEMRSISPEWAALVSNWDKIESLPSEELPSGKAPRTYELMQSVMKESE